MRHSRSARSCDQAPARSSSLFIPERVVTASWPVDGHVRVIEAAEVPT